MGLLRNAGGNSGSVLVTAAILATCLAMFLASYFRLGAFAYEQAQRNFLQNASLDLAEAGLEEALWALTRREVTEDQGWSVNLDLDGDGLEDDAHKRLVFADLSNGQGGSYTVAVLNYAAEEDLLVYSEAECEMRGKPSVRKQLRIHVDRESLFRYGLVGKDSVALSGSSVIDSFDSSLGPYGTAPVGYRGFIGTHAAVDGRLDLANGTIRGGIATGGGTIDYDASASVHTDEETRYSGDAVPYPRDFDMGTPEVAPPDTSGATAYATIAADETLSAPGVYWIGSVSINNKTLTIEGPGAYELVIPGGLEVGNGSLVLTGDPQVTIYLGGDLAVAGGGRLNPSGAASNLLLYGTSAGPVFYTLHGNTRLHAALYALNADVSLRGTEGMCGAVVANAIRFSGNYAFHYDEQLGAIPNGDTFAARNWVELRRGDAGYIDLNSE